MIKYEWLEDDIRPAYNDKGEIIIGILQDIDVTYSHSQFHWKGISSKYIDNIIRYSEKGKKWN